MVLTFRVDCRKQDKDIDSFLTQGFDDVRKAMAAVRHYRAEGWSVTWERLYWSEHRTPARQVLAVGGRLLRQERGEEDN